MTSPPERVFAEAAKLPEAGQGERASHLLAELAADDHFDRAIAGAARRLAGLAAETLAEHQAGST